MSIDFSLEKAIKTRYSVRTYEDRMLSEQDRKKIESYMTQLSNPFAIAVTFHLLEKKPSAEGEKLGTYGVIKGAADYLCATVSDGDLALEALGYSFEKLILYATSLGLGTCWLGGTFNRSGFAQAIQLKPGELFPCISPVGYPTGKKRVMETLVRKMAKADQRKEWNTLFYGQDFAKSLTKTDAGDYAFALDMVRLAPSAVNRQPWRIVQDHHAYHFYQAGEPKSDPTKLDIRRVDLGIAACHFHLATLEKGLSGRFEQLAKADIQSPEPMQYAFSWVQES